MIFLKPGLYVAAVSGGVDSVVLLNMLSKKPELKVVVAHFNHGIRPDSEKDELFVSDLASQYGYIFTAGHGRLGKGTNEEKARKARYGFLYSVKKEHKAKAILTAHHQDDIIETAIINLIRGTNRKGLSSLSSTDKLIRPLKDVSKSAIILYAQNHKLKWREDPTNLNPKYLRNWVRLNIMPKINQNAETRKEVLELIEQNRKTNKLINPIVATLSQQLLKTRDNRQEFIMLPNNIAKEVLADIFKRTGIKDIDSKTLSTTVVYIKTGRAGTAVDIKDGYRINLSKLTFNIEKPKVKAPLI